jgi:lipid A ethanolaminephosphotransferase
MAPDAQKHIGSLFWFGKALRNDANIKKLAQKRTAHFSHDNLFHTLLGLFRVKTKVYDPKLDMLHTQ